MSNYTEDAGGRFTGNDVGCGLLDGAAEREIEIVRDGGSGDLLASLGPYHLRSRALADLAFGLWPLAFGLWPLALGL